MTDSINPVVNASQTPEIERLMGEHWGAARHPGHETRRQRMRSVVRVTAPR